jgi:hypothetical protein
VHGIDYFSLPKAYLNLLEGRSAFDTWGGVMYGPYATWYLSHPALAVLVGSWFSFLAPWTSYGVFTLFSLAVMAFSAYLLARETQDPLTRRWIWLLLLGAFPTYWMLFVGNVQCLLVLAVAMVFAGLYEFASAQEQNSARARRLLFAGLLLSLLTKPMLLLLLPLLLLLKETRKTVARAAAIYIAVSLLFLIVPTLNPEPVGPRALFHLLLSPGFVRDHMNIYTNHFVLNAYMKDNSIHWLNLVAQSQMRLMHVDVYSLPVFMDTLLGTRTPGWIYQLPTAMVLLLSFAVARMQATRMRLECALLLAMAISLVFFLGYPTVWEYQYTSVLPVAAMLLLVKQGAFFERSRWWMFALAACAWLPSLYFLVEGRELTAGVLTVIRADRVVPVLLLFLLMSGELIAAVVREYRRPVAHFCENPDMFK